MLKEIVSISNFATVIHIDFEVIDSILHREANQIFLR